MTTKEFGYQEKFILIKPWFREIIEVVKRDLKNEHLKKDREFCKRYFFGRGVSHIRVEEMVPAYEKDIAEGNVGLAEFISTRWLFKNTDVYGYFEEKLSTIDADFEALESLADEQAIPLMDSAVKQFGATRTYIFALLNGVVFSDALFEKLKEMAEKETVVMEEKNRIKTEAESMEVLKQRHAREVSALTGRFEKKMRGMEKKYLRDTEGLKKQIANLQKKC